ncbi:hypothetical protein M8494_19815 [Serratia ureilytica]
MTAVSFSSLLDSLGSPAGGLHRRAGSAFNAQLDVLRWPPVRIFTRGGSGLWPGSHEPAHLQRFPQAR